MALKDNNPTFTYVSWSGLLITYDKQTYQIQNSHTNMKYVYWDVTNPYTLQCYNRTQSAKAGLYQICINDKGIATERSHEDVVISWDGDNSDLIASQIFGLHESNKETGSKFVAIETTIDGIKQTVGATQEEMGKLTEKVSVIEQKADSIDLSVKELTQEFADNKELNELRENLNKSIIDFNSSLGIFKSEIYTYYKDNTIDQEEKVKINTHLDVIDSKRAEAIKFVDIVITMMESEGQTTQVNKLNSAKTKFVNSVSNLRTYITTAISDGTVVPSEITAITDLFAKCNIAINELKNTCDDCIFLGAGGSITTELARIGIKSDEIILSVSESVENITNDVDLIKQGLEGQINDVENALNDFQDVVNSTFKDGIIDAAEKEILLGKIQVLDKEKLDIDTQYNALYVDVHLKEPVKTQLKKDYDSYVTKHGQLKTKLEEVISDGLINEAEKAQINTLMSEYATELAKAHKSMNKAIDDISLNKARDEVSKAKEELQGNINDVDDKVDGLDGFINGVFADNILSDSEKKTLLQNIKTLEREKIDIDNKYNELYKNIYLDGQMKIDLKNSYDGFVVKFNEAITYLNDLINKTGNITQEDRNGLGVALDNLKAALGLYSTQYQKAIEYIRKKELDAAKDELNSQITDVSGSLDNLENTMNTSFKDGVISKAEAIAIKEDIKRLNTEKVDIDNNYTTLYNNKFLLGQDKSNLKIYYDRYAFRHNDLVTYINTSISDEKVTEEEKNMISQKLNAYDSALGEYKVYQVKAVDSIAFAQADDIKTQLDKDIADLNDALEGLDDILNGAFEDGILSDAEKLVIKQQLQTISKEKGDIDKQYETIYNNADLIGVAKTNFKSAYDTYNAKYLNLVSVINNIVNKVGLVDTADQARLNNAFDEYSTASSNYNKRANEAIDAIADKKADDAESNANKHTESQIKVVSDAISLKVSQTEYDSNKNEISNKFSQLEQTVDGFEFSLSQAGADNILYNASFENSMEYWHINKNPQVYNASGYGGDSLYIFGQMPGDGQGVYQIFNTEVGYDYTVSFDAVIDENRNGNTEIGIEGVKVINVYGNTNWTKRHSLTFKATKTQYSFVSYVANGVGVYLDNVKVCKGRSMIYSPHPNELYVTKVKIDDKGLSVKNGAISIYNNDDRKMLYAKDNGDLAFAGEMRFENPDNPQRYVGLIPYIDGNSMQMSAILAGDVNSRFRFLYNGAEGQKEFGFFGHGGFQVNDNFTLYSEKGNTWYWNDDGYLYPKVGNTGFIGTESNRFSKVFTNGVGAPRHDGDCTVEGYYVFLRSNYAGDGIILDEGGAFRPTSQGDWNLGAGYGRFATVYANHLDIPSDAKLKENIQYINSSNVKSSNLDTVTDEDIYSFVKDELKIATYNYNNKNRPNEKNNCVGFIAQDIQDNKVAQMFLRNNECPNEEENHLSYDLPSYVSVLGGALSKALEKIEVLEKEIEKLKAR